MRAKAQRMANRHPGFTLVELMVILAIIAILATLALPSFQSGFVRSQIVEAAKLTDIAKRPIAAAWAGSGELPPDNLSVGLPAPDRVVSTHVSAMWVENGAIHLQFGNKAHGLIHGKTLSFRPAVVEGAQVVPVSWVCGHASAPNKMTARGADRTNVPANVLPLNCKAD